MTWGPFHPGVDWPERKCQLRSLRTALKLLTGERGKSAGIAALRAEINQDTGLLLEAEAEFERLAPLDRRRVLSSFAAVNFEKLGSAG